MTLPGPLPREIGPLLRARYGGPVRKLRIRLGTTCPHRGPQGGCAFCAEGLPRPAPPVAVQLAAGVARLRPGTRAIAYLQDHTATLLPPEELDHALSLLVNSPAVVAIHVGTRPDALPPPILEVLAAHARRTDLLVEIGLQSALDATLELVRRGHTVEEFGRATDALHGRGLRVCAHVILGLPTPRAGAIGVEDAADAVLAARLLGRLRVEAVKIHNCHVLEGTALADLFRAGRYAPPDLEGYLDRLVPFLEHLSPEVELHRLVGEARPPELLAPDFTARKAAALARIRAALVERGAVQGRHAQPA